MNFDRLAPFYRAAEWLLAGRTLQRARERWLGELAGRRDILLVGEGHGRGLEAVLRAAPAAEVTVVEASAGMIAVAQARLRRKGLAGRRVHWVHADVRDWAPPAGRFDAVLTQFFLDCFAPEALEAVVARLGAAADGGAVWLLSDFRIPEAGWRRRRAQAIHRLMYLFFNYATRLEARRLTPPDAALRAAGFRLRGRAGFCQGLVHADVWSRGDGRG